MDGFSRILVASALLMATTGASAAAGVRDVTNKTISEKTTDYEIAAEYPQTGIKSIDDAIAAWVREEVAQFRHEADPDLDSAAGAWTVDLHYEIKRNDATGFAVLFAELAYTGGAHPNHGYTSFNFLMPEGRRVELPEILDGPRGLRRLSALATADLLKRLTVPEAGMDPDWIKRGAAPEWSNFDTFVLQPDLIEFTFPPYQVASYADGVQESSVALGALKGYLRKDWRTPAASFDCTKATTPVEQAICADAPLARLDREVAAAYARTLARASAPDDKQATIAQQRRWLGDRDAACRDEAESARVACLSGVYRVRLAELVAPL